ncbi:phage/plasmid primase, P4 family, partial [Acidobacteria bacterium AH-259-O06]|nr:phage/plasmid primase, P4 family [Acidobacteria bacterium AH-259-O06]
RPITTKDLDSHPFLLNCRNGTLDLKTGELREHRREDYLTKLVHFEYNPKAECPQFRKFLYEIMGLTPGSSEGEQLQIDRLVKYLQKAFGYASTGDVSEKKVFCFFGSGDNGKTTLLEAIRHVLAEYSHQLLIDSLMARTGRETNASLADLADLRGARFVTTSEGERGQRLAEAKLKYLTAGMGEIKTCRKYENPIMFPATHKLFIDSNYKPHVRGTDNAIWTRLSPMPFTVTIPPKQVNKKLLTELKREGEGILAWLVEGCTEWQRDGLSDPQEVSESAKTWRDENNPIQDFIDDVCIFDIRVDKQPFCSTAALSHAYRQWVQDNSEKDVLTTMEFGDLLGHMGCTRSKREISGKQKRIWVGIGFKEIAQNDNKKTPPETSR